MNVRIRKLEPSDKTLVGRFDCGDPDLNDFLRRYAIGNPERQMYSATYIAVSPDIAHQILGYYTIANTSIPRITMPESIVHGQPRYPDIPAVVIGRLATEQMYKGKGIGAELLRDSFIKTLQVASISGSRYLVTLAYPSAVQFYEKYGFIEIGTPEDGKKTRRMALDLRTLRKAVENDCQS